MRFLLSVLLVFLIISVSKSEDFNELISNLVDKVILGLDFSSPKKVCVFEFENFTPRSSAFIQNLYQLFLATLEKKFKESVIIEDEVVGFDEDIGYFNLSEEKDYDYLFSVTYSEREGNASLSLKVFDRRKPDKLIAFFYSSLPLNLEEIELIEKSPSRQFFFILPIYEPIYLPFAPLDVKFFNESKLIFLTEKKVVFYNLEGERLKLSDEISLNWEPPFSPSQDLTGRVYFELINETPVLFVDSSLSASGLIFFLKENQWVSDIPVKYIPSDKINIGGKVYFLGIKTMEGMNSFKGKVALIQPSSILNDDSEEGIRELELIPFYDVLAINDEKGRFFGIYIVDDNGKLRFFNRNFRELKIPEFRVGDRLISIGNYILCSSFGSDENDSLIIISPRERKILQEVPLRGHIISMAYDGNNKIAVLCRDKSGGHFLHLWGKK